MKIITFMILLAICGCLGNNTSNLMDSYNRAGARSAAEKFIKGTDDYGFNGRGVSCEDAKMMGGVNSWELRCTYRVAASVADRGVGHEVIVTVDSNVVKKAVLDGNKTLI